MKKRKNFFKVIIAGMIITAGMAAVIIYRIDTTPPDDPRSIYNRQYKWNKQLRQEVDDFVAKKHIEALFYQHQEELQAFADKCYENRDGKHFKVYYLDEEPYYFCINDHNNYDEANRKKETAVREGEYSYITEFMDYAIENKMVFRDWMLYIGTPEPVNEDEWREKKQKNLETILCISIYEGIYKGTYAEINNAIELDVYFIYAPYAEIDYSDVFEESYEVRFMNGKTVRMTPNWYYEYRVTYH